MENNISTRLKVLTKEEYDKNPAFYQKSFKRIHLSIFPCAQKWQLTNWNDFFKRHPINSIVFLTEGSTIVSYMYTTPHRDYPCYEDTDLVCWGINFIQTHVNHQKKGYGKRVLLFGLKDMLTKGAGKVTACPNDMSRPILMQIIEEFGFSYEDRCNIITLLDISKIKNDKSPSMVYLRKNKEQ